jgi:hypothetical protein
MPAVMTIGLDIVKHPLIAPRIAEAMEKAEVKALLSLEGHMEELKALCDLAKEAKQLSAAISAEVKRGELRKFYIKQVENGNAGDFDFKNMSDEELEAIINEPIGFIGAGQC